MGFLNWLAGASQNLGSFGQWFSIFGDGIQETSNKMENYGQIAQAITDSDATMAERAENAVEGLVDQTITGRITDFCDRFLPRWMARGIGTLLGNIGGDIAGNLAHSVVENVTGSKEATEKPATEQTTPDVATVAQNNGYGFGQLDVDGDGKPDRLTDMTGANISPSSGAVIPDTQNQELQPAGA